MSRLVWLFGWSGVAVWSLFCLAVYGVLKFAGGAALSHADVFSSDPETVEWIWRVLSFLYSVSSGAVLVGWAVVSLLILSVPWLFDRMVGSARTTGEVQVFTRGGPGGFAAGAGRTGGPFRPPGSADRDVIDLAPGQYDVGPARQSGSVPSIGTKPGSPS